MQTPFPVDQTQTAIAIAYQNRRTIADRVLPRVSAGYRFAYVEHDLAQGFTVPDTAVGRKGKPTEVEFKGRELTGQVETYALDDAIPLQDINASKGSKINPVNNATEYLTRLITLDREIRVAAMVFEASIYSASLRVQLSGSSQWSDSTSKPIDTIMTGLDAVIMRPNIMVIGQQAFTKLSTHPEIVRACRSIGGDSSGIVKAQEIAALFGLEEVLVGEALVNTARKGQTASMARVWGKHCALIYQEKPAETRNATTFGFTAEAGTRKAGAMEDANIGAEGGMRVRVWEQVKEVIAAPSLGYFIQDAVA